MNHALIVCGGNSNRFGQDKILASLLGRPLLLQTLLPFEKSAAVDTITIVAHEANVDAIRALTSGYPKIRGVVLGGDERHDSVRLGIHAIAPNANDILIIHNGANPLVSISEIELCVRAAEDVGAASVGFPVRDSLRSVEGDLVSGVIDRRGLWQMQTPQCIRASLYDPSDAHTDEAGALFSRGNPVRIVRCSHRNVKVTSPEDIALVSGALLSTRREGIGEDSHRFSEGRKLILGGAHIPAPFGFDANSDGDVLLHALCNAVGSALGERSLSSYADDKAKDGETNSAAYVAHILSVAHSRGHLLTQATFSVEALRPKLEPHHDAIKESLCRILSLPPDRVGITFTSGEGLTPEGRGDGMRCRCLAVLDALA